MAENFEAVLQTRVASSRIDARDMLRHSHVCVYPSLKPKL